jgi:hypothetical protein
MSSINFIVVVLVCTTNLRADIRNVNVSFSFFSYFVFEIFVYFHFQMHLNAF